MNKMTTPLVIASALSLYLGSRWCAKDEFSPWYTKLFGIGRPDYPFEIDAQEEYEEVVKIFKNNFKEGREVGASITVYSNGEKVVDLYGGYQDFEKKIPFTKESLCTVYSSSKFMSVMVIAYLVDQGLLSYEDKVSKYWPEFAKNGKENVTLADVLRHEAGIPYLEGNQPTYEEVQNLDILKNYLENQRHLYDGENIRAYHAITRGFILNELVRRVHPKNYTIGKIYKEEINPLLNIEFNLGLPKELEPRRSVWYRYPKLDLFSMMLPRAFIGDKKYTFNPKILSKDSIIPKIMKLRLGKGDDQENSREFAEVEAPSSNGFTNSNSLARTAAFLANKGELDEVKLMSPEAVLTSVDGKISRFDNAILMETIMTQGGFGVSKYPELGPQLAETEFYGWFGAGGSMVAFNLEYNFAFSYVMNAQHFNTFYEGRAHRLFIAAFKAHYHSLRK